MSRLEVGGVGIYYEVHGSGPPIVLTHAFACTSRMWDRQVARWCDRHTVVVYDCRGFGASDAPSDPAAYSQARLVADLGKLLDHLSLETAVLGGLSMGGNLSLAYALEHPERVDRLILADTGGGSDPGAASAAELGRSPLRVLEEGGMDGFVDYILGPEAGVFDRYSAQGPQAAAHMRGLVASSPPLGLARILSEVLMKRPGLYGLEASLRRLRVPTLVVVGEYDELAGKVSRFLAATLPDAELVVVPGSGHMTNLEDPSAFNAAVEAFLERPL